MNYSLAASRCPAGSPEFQGRRLDVEESSKSCFAPNWLPVSSAFHHAAVKNCVAVPKLKLSACGSLKSRALKSCVASLWVVVVKISCNSWLGWDGRWGGGGGWTLQCKTSASISMSNVWWQQRFRQSWILITQKKTQQHGNFALPFLFFSSFLGAKQPCC